MSDVLCSYFSVGSLLLLNVEHTVRKLEIFLFITRNVCGTIHLYAMRMINIAYI